MYYKPSWDLIKGGEDLVAYFDKVSFSVENFRGSKCNRIVQLKELIDNKAVSSKELRMIVSLCQ